MPIINLLLLNEALETLCADGKVHSKVMCNAPLFGAVAIGVVTVAFGATTKLTSYSGTLTPAGIDKILAIFSRPFLHYPKGSGYACCSFFDSVSNSSRTYSNGAVRDKYVVKE